MKRKILIAVLVMIFTWSMGDVDAVWAEGLDDIPSGGEIVAVGLLAALGITALIVVIANSGGDEEIDEEDDVPWTPAEPPGREYYSIDPVLTLQKDAVGAGLSFSF